MGVRLAQQVFGFVDFVRGIDGDQDGADPGTGEKGQQPFGVVGGPDGHMVTGSHADRQQAAGNAVDFVEEFAVGPGIVACGVFDRRLVGKDAGDALDQLAEGQVDPFVFAKERLALWRCGWGFTGECGCRGARLACGLFARTDAGPGAVKGLQGVGKGRENDCGILEVAAPALDPFERDETGVALVLEQVEGLLDRQVAMPEHAVLDLGIGKDRVFDVDVADVFADGAPGLFRCLAEKAVRVVDVPEDTDSRVIDGLDQGFQAAGIGIDTIGFDQDGDVFPLGIIGQGGQGAGDCCIVHRTLDFRSEIAEHADKRDSGPGGEVDVFESLGKDLLAPGWVFEAAA